MPLNPQVKEISTFVTTDTFFQYTVAPFGMRSTPATSITLSLAECELGQAMVTHLGKVVGQGQVRPVNSRIEVILSFPTSVSWSKLRCLLGMAGYKRSVSRKFGSVQLSLIC